MFPPSTEGDLLPPVQLLLPEYPAVGAATGDPGGHPPVLASVPATARPQVAACRLSAEAGAADHQVSASTQGAFIFVLRICITEVTKPLSGLNKS